RSSAAEGMLVYRVPPVPKSLEKVYNPPTFSTLASQVKSKANLRAMAKQMKLEIPPENLDKLIKAGPPEGFIGAETVVVTLEWDDPEKAAEMVNTLMEIFVADVVDSRKQALRALLDETTANLERTNAELEKVRAK